MRRDGLPVFGILAVKLLASCINNGCDNSRPYTLAMIGKSRVGLGEIERGNRDSPEADGQFAREVGLKPKGFCPVDDIANADLLGHAHGAGIARKRKRLRKPQLALVIVFVIGRFPDFVGVRIYINKRRIQNRR